MDNLLIVATTPSFLNVMNREAGFKDKVEKNGFTVLSRPNIAPPFDYDCEKVFAVIAGDAGNKTFGAKEIDYLPNLKIVMPFGVGINHIILKDAKEKGIVVANAPGANRHAVAELTIGFIIALLRNIAVSDRDLRNKVWDRKVGLGSVGKRLGIIGLGNIGKEVARLALGIGMKVAANDIVYDENFMRSYDIERLSFEELLKRSDIVTLHAPLTELTQSFINSHAISLMKSGCYLINTSRGEDIDIPALLLALEAGKVAGAAFDVFSEEPPFANPHLRELIMHPKVISTPHIASYTPESQLAVAERIFESILAVKNNKLEILNRVG